MNVVYLILFCQVEPQKPAQPQPVQHQPQHQENILSKLKYNNIKKFSNENNLYRLIGKAIEVLI